MSSIVQVIIQKTGGQSKSIVADQNWSVNQLKEKVDAVCMAGIGIDNFNLVYGGTTLVTGSLLQNHIPSQGIIFICQLLPGGSNLKPLPGYITLTDDASKLTGDDEPSEKRAKMPCGCPVSVDEMLGYIDGKLKSGDYKFVCPNCEVEWKYFCIRHVLSSIKNVQELQAIDIKVNENYSNKKPGIQQCPFCHSYCAKNPNATMLYKNRLMCLVCTKKTGSRVEFCWSCLSKWNGNGNFCGNAGCAGEDPRIKYLRTCDVKTVGEVSGVPSVRACAKCGTMINHTEKCKHMKCNCGYEFCFVCLQSKFLGIWTCGSHSSPCRVAPRQTSVVEN